MGAGQAILGASEFGVTGQALQSAATLYAGTQRLR
jgi:hypothetical protein